MQSSVSPPVCLERLTALVACLLYLILLETRIPYQPFPEALLRHFAVLDEWLRQGGPCCIHRFAAPSPELLQQHPLLSVNQIKQSSLD